MKFNIFHDKNKRLDKMYLWPSVMKVRICGYFCERKVKRTKKLNKITEFYKNTRLIILIILNKLLIHELLNIVLLFSNLQFHLLCHYVRQLLVLFRFSQPKLYEMQARLYIGFRRLYNLHW